jgi:hypothetical protein
VFSLGGHSRSPYAVRETPFRFPALAALAGRGQIGGDREVALAFFLTARLVNGLLPPNALTAPARVTRAAAAKHWLSALALPAALKAPFARLAEATAKDETSDAQSALRAVITAAGATLDAPSRAELERLASDLELTR